MFFCAVVMMMRIRGAGAVMRKSSCSEGQNNRPPKNAKTTRVNTCGHVHDHIGYSIFEKEIDAKEPKKIFTLHHMCTYV